MTREEGERVQCVFKVVSEGCEQEADAVKERIDLLYCITQLFNPRSYNTHHFISKCAQVIPF